MRKVINLKNCFNPKSQYPSSISLMFLLVPSVIWTLSGIAICYFTKAGLFEISAVFFPPLVVWFTYALANKYIIPGGIVLVLEGTFVALICLRYLSLSQNILMFTLFILPITLTGLIFIFSKIKFLMTIYT
jgi:hypothetical protein